MNTYTVPVSITVQDLRCENTVNPLGVDTPAPRLSWQVRNFERNFRQAVYEVQAASTRERLVSGTPDLWDSGEVASAQSVLVPYSGLSLSSCQTCWWWVRVVDVAGRDSDYSAPAFWEMGLLHDADWHGHWIGRTNACLSSWQAPVLPAPLLRTAFVLPAPPSRARVYVCGLGFYELWINGRKVGRRVLDPVVTQYDRHAGYATLDVTEYLTAGENALGVMLGNGWYNCSTEEVWHSDKAAWRDYPKLRLQMHAALPGGEEFVLHSGPSWKVADGPVRFDALRNGESYDGRAEVEGWAAPGFQDAEWKHATVVPGPGGVLLSQQMPSTTVLETLPPVQSWRLASNVTLHDFGQNMAGWARLEATLPPGTEVHLEYGERLDADRNLDTAHIAQFIKSGPFQTDTYMAQGGVEVWEPRFTYHGFQYVKVTTDAPPDAPLSLEARVVGTDFEDAGGFACSNPLLNRLQDCTRRSYRSNFVGIPTDCPHREKNGWTGDALLAAETGLYNYNAATAYAHWLRTMADTQRPNGAFPGIVPTAGWGYNWGSGPAWDSAFLLLPWHIWEFRGDLRPLQTHFPQMARYMDFVVQMASDGIVRWGLGDWCAPRQDKTAPDALVTTAYAFAGSRLLARAARLLGEDAQKWEAVAHTFRQAWRREFLGADGQCAGDEQTSLACALYFDLADDERPRVAARLRDAVARAGGRPTFGIHGAKWCLRVLADAGDAETAYALLTQPQFPGWMHWLAQGATTLWEDWHGESSRNHIMFGDVSAWLLAYVAGIRSHPDGPGFRRITIRPHFVQDLEWAEGWHDCPYGRIESSWRRERDLATLRVTVPANTTADICLPDAAPVSAASGTYEFVINNR